MAVIFAVIPRFEVVLQLLQVDFSPLSGDLRVVSGWDLYCSPLSNINPFRFEKILVLHRSRLIRVEPHNQDNKTKDLTSGSPLPEIKERSKYLLIVDHAQMECWNHR
jgi:hypothetical protein